MSVKRKRILIGGIVFIIVGACVSLVLAPQMRLLFAGRILSVQSAYVERGGHFTHEGFTVVPGGIFSLRGTCRNVVFAAPEKRFQFKAPVLCVRWSLLSPRKFKIFFPDGAELCVPRLNTLLLGKNTCAVLPLSWKNMRPAFPKLYLQHIRIETDRIELPKRHFMAFRGEDFALSWSPSEREVLSSGGEKSLEPTLVCHVTIKRLGCYFGNFPVWECGSEAQVALTHPQEFAKSFLAWRDVGGLIECENFSVQLKDVQAKLRGSFTLSPHLLPEEGAFTLELKGEKGLVDALQGWAMFLPRKFQDIKKCGRHLLIPLNLRERKLYVNDRLLFDSGTFKDETLELLLHDIEEGKFLP